MYLTLSGVNSVYKKQTDRQATGCVAFCYLQRMAESLNVRQLYSCRCRSSSSVESQQSRHCARCDE